MSRLEVIKRYNKVILNTFFHAKKIIDNSLHKDDRFKLMSTIIELWDIHMQDMKSLTDDEVKELKYWFEHEFSFEDQKLLELFIDDVAWYEAYFRSIVYCRELNNDEPDQALDL